jgi:hypothetical protein
MCACVLTLLHTAEIVLHVARAAHVVHVRLVCNTYNYSHQVTITFRVIAQAIPTLAPFGLAAVSRQAAAYAAAVLRTRRVNQSGRAMLELFAPVFSNSRAHDHMKPKDRPCVQADKQEAGSNKQTFADTQSRGTNKGRQPNVHT